MNRRIPGSMFAVLLLLLFAPFATSSASGSGNCLDFDGSDDYAEGSGLSTSMTSITLEAWVYHRTLPSSVERYITVQGNLAVLRHDGWSQQGQLHFYIKTDGVQRDIRVNGALQDDRWYHVVGTWDGTDMKLYLNGEEVGTLAPGGSLDAPSGNIRLSSSGEPMDGYMDEVRIWSVARSADEIRGNMYKTLGGSETDLESYWKLDETSGSTAYDAAGSVDLTLYNMTNEDWVTSGAFAGPRNALDFDGTDDYVSIPSSTSLDNSQFSTEFWVKMDDPGNWDGIIDKGRSTDSDWYFLTRMSALGEGVVFGIGSGSSRAELSYSWSDASWHHVTGTYDGTNMILYVDGVQRGSRTASMSVTTNNIRIGSRRNGTYHFEGKLDEVRIWNDVRTSTEIQEHMCKTMEGDESNLVAYWRFDQEVETTLYDITSNDNHGALTNMANDDWVACNAFNTWIGCDGNVWSVVRNWSLGSVPNSTSVNVGIPYYADGDNTIYINDADYTCNHLAISSGATLNILSGRTLKVNGNAFCSSSQIGDGEVEFSGASATHGLSGAFSNVELNEANGAELAGDATINGTLTLTSGIFTVGAHTLTIRNPIGGTDTNLSADSSSSITVAGSATGVNIPSSVTVLNNCILNNSNGTTLQSNLQLDGTLTLTNGALTLNGHTLSYGSTGILKYNGASSQTTSDAEFPASNGPFDLTIDNSNDVNLAFDRTIDGTLTLTDGIFTVGANTLTLKNAIAGTAMNLSAGNTSSITIAGSGTGVNIPSSVTELNNVTLDNTNGTALQNSLELDGILTLSSGAFTVGANALTLKNAIAGTATNLSAGNTSSITIAGSGTGINIPSSVIELSDLFLDNANGTILQNNLELDGTLTLTDGVFTLNGHTLSYGPSGTLKYNGASSQTTSDAEFPSSNGPYNLTIDNSNGVNLAFSRTIDGTISLANGDLNLDGNTLTLGASATLSESEGNTIKGTSGVITTTRTFNAGDLSAGVNIAGMGAEITTDADLGSTVITRGHGVQTDAGEESILRYYDINPTNNSGLDAAFVFHYDDSELNGLNEAGLELYRSTDLGGTWASQGGTVDTGNETITLSGLDAFSRWTAFDSSILFTNAVSLTGVHYCSVAWGDYDNDGDLDVLLAGRSSSGDYITRIYRNDGSGTFTDISAGLPGLSYCSVAWGDYDNDGDLDVLLAGSTGSGYITRIYRNEGLGTFTDIGAGLPGVCVCDVAWGDYDNDGDLDVLLAGNTGSGFITRIYRNEGSGTFNDISAGLPGVDYCSVAWGDYDNDGDLDVLLAGCIGAASSITRIYRNDDLDTFTDIGAGLPGVRNSNVAWGDHDNDGDLDVLLAGSASSGRITRIYRNAGSGTFTDIGAGLTGVSYCSLVWGDYDNDGDLDVLLAGSASSSRITRIYRNEGSGTFTDIGAGLTGVSYCSLAWGDYDNDGDLDVLLAGDTGSGYITCIYQSDNPLGNTVPNAPTNLTATGSGQDVALSWDKATDAETDQNALTYNLRIGTTSGGIETESPMANVGTGWRRVPALGKTNHNNSWTIKGLNNTTTYYWSVQAIDNAFAGSGFAAEGSFTIDFPVATTAAITSITKTTATCGGEVTQEGTSSVTAKGIVWDASEDPTVGVHLGMTNDGSGLGAFVSSLTGLASGQTYYVRAYAMNAEHTAYGETKVFATNMTPPGNGLDFDGSNDYVDVGQTSGLPIYNNGTGDAYTVSMWVKGGVQSDKRVFAEASTAGNSPLFAIGAGTGGSDGVKLFIRDDGNTTLLNATSTYAAFDGTWHHIAWVDSSGTATLYVDGKPDATDFSYTRGMLTLNRTSIGAIVRASASSHFTGEIDEVCLWNVARSETDIRNDINKVLNGDEVGLVAYYRFDHLSGTALSDRTTNDNDGTLMNMDDADWATSAASVGHESHIGTGTGNLSENVDVPVDITWDGDDPGTDAIFAAIQVDDAPDVVTGLPAYYDSTYWELWIAHEDGSFQADAAFHYDNLSGISDEATLALYTRTAPGQSWTVVAGATIDYEGSTTDGVGSITANNLTAFSQFIIAGGQEMTLDGSVSGSDLVLEWTTCPSATAYWVYGADNEAYFEPELTSPYMHRQTVIVPPTTTWTSSSGIGETDHNWVYLVIAVDGSEQEITRSNRAGEHDFMLP